MRASLYFDSAKERIIFSLPYFDGYTAYRGTIIFYVNIDDFVRSLIQENIISLNTRSVIVAETNDNVNKQSPSNIGLAFNVPFTSRMEIKNEILKKWNRGLTGLEQLVKNENDGRTLILISSQNSKYVTLAWICDESEFEFSYVERILILTAVFITIFLVVFLLFNIRHDDMVIIQGRVRKFQKALLSEYVEGKSSGDWAALSHELNLRRQDVNDEIKKSLGKRGKKHSKELNNLLDESWKELFAAVSGGTSLSGGNPSDLAHDERNAGELENVAVSGNAAGAADVEEIEPVEELESLDADEVSTVEEVGPSEEGGALNVEEVEAVEEVAPVEELKPFEEVETENVDAVYAVEEIGPSEDEEASNVEESASLEDEPRSTVEAIASSVKDVTSPVDETASPDEGTPSPDTAASSPDEEILSLVEEINREEDDVPDLPPEESERVSIKKRGSLMELASQAAERATENLDVNRVKTSSLLQHALRLKEEKENDKLDFEIYSPDFSFLDKEENK